ncbi:putative membrane protein [Wickerhamomyces ciferrii]|uniref:Membrane protein n=1 Tax=Wickerhamomyces ciferrii (strain ATCC 14091 / BCRC 22168 / CBS 111 / JCM 3599 / NBRC 0793 / NRRL Y-1031 F-60-10) TaxID=1206466 RepID=K0KNS5_WICCF|nr:uncharacterized protein BN7_4205 [Wickerhamomyces ciferrii]CCH44636.1 putative membrane protein [Wickerhamomyces ciferrii]
MKSIYWFLLILGFLSTQISAAYVRTFTCDSNRRIIDGNEKNGSPLFDKTSPIAEVMIRDENIIYRLEFVTSMEISDINYTTNSITTLQIDSSFLNGVVLFEKKRLCDYVSIVPNVSNETNHDHNLWPDEDIPLEELLGLTSSDNNNSISQNSINSNEISTQTSLLQPHQSLTTGPFVVPSDTHSTPPIIIKRDQDVSFHRDSVCPLKPGIRYQILFAANTSSPRFFGSYETKFTILSADQEIGCIQVYATPYHPIYITYSICFGVMAIFIFGFFTNFYIFHYSIHQETTNVFLFMASSICNEPLLNELTPDLTMLLNFLQFVLFSLALNLAYPGFLQPIASFINWVCLIRIDLFSNAFINPMSKNGVYKTLGMQGLFGIFPETGAPDGLTASNMWKSFITWCWIATLFLIIVTQIFISIKQFLTKNYKISGLKSRITNSIGIITQLFYCVFPLPFVAFSSFLILGLSTKAPNIEISSSIVCIIFFIIWLFGIGWFSYMYLITKREKLYSSFNVISCWSSLYHWYKPECSYFVMIEKFKILFQGMVIGFAQSNGTVQISLLLFAELSYLLLLTFIKPFFNKNRNFWSIFVSIASSIIVGLNIPYIRDLNVEGPMRGIIGDVQLLIIVISLLGFFIFFVLRLTKVILLKLKYNNNWIDYDPSRKSSLDEEFMNETRGTTNEKFNDLISYDNDDYYGEKYNGNLPSFKINDYNNNKDLEPEFSFEKKPIISPIITSNFPRPRLENQNQNQEKKLLSRRNSNSGKSSIIELTDSRALPGLSLNYLSSNENLPKVSPIDDEYLANLDKNDSEVHKLWAKRKINKKKSNNNINGNFQRYDTNSTYSNSLFTRIKKSIDQESRDDNSTVKESGFAVMGRKPIQIKTDTIHET